MIRSTARPVITLLLAREGRSGSDALLLRYANTDASAFYPWNMD